MNSLKILNPATGWDYHKQDKLMKDTKTINLICNNYINIMSLDKDYIEHILVTSLICNS